jgi:hypothetical protein
MTFPTVAEVSRITAERDRVVRNLKITECYSRLAAAIRARTGTAANWCTFATWASRQAGSTIRGEDFFERFQRCLGRRSWLTAPVQSLSRMFLRKGIFEPTTTLGRMVAEIHTPFDAFERASAAVAEGNLKVFEEIGREFARFLETVPADARPESPEFRAFAEGLRSGPPPDGQQYLKEAFAHYQQQRHERDAASQAAWMLLANLKIGLHEQTRLQPQIAAAVDSPFTTAEDLGARLLHMLIPGSVRWRYSVQRPFIAALGWMASRIRREAIGTTREAVTGSMMVLTLPAGVLSLGCNLSAPVPSVFVRHSHQALGAFERRYDPCGPDGGDCGARDWCDLGQRMHYILHLFRAYAEEPSLWSTPFTPEQVACFESGRVPEGNL